MTDMEEVPLFEAPTPPPLRQPKVTRSASSKAKYAPYGPTIVGRCDDCQQVAYEALREGRLDAPAIRQARYRRTQGGVETLLCVEHKNLAEAADAKAAA